MRLFRSIVLMLLLVSPVAIYSQENEENLDDLFAAPEEDIVVEEPETDHRTQFEVLDKFKISGNFKAEGVIAAGWTNWNFFNDISDGFDASAGLESSFSITVDARPAPYFHLVASLSTSFDPYSSLENVADISDLKAIWSEPAISTLYCDYILKDTLFTRIGKFSMGWGQGRFYTPGNLMSDSSNSAFNFRFTLPALFGLSFVLLTNNSINYLDFSYAGKIDFVFGETMISPAINFSYWGGLETLLSLKQVLFKTDFLIDFTTLITHTGLQSAYVVAGFFREWDEVKLYGEYQYSWIQADDIPHNHVASLALGLNNPFGAPFDLGIQVQQNFVDWSGTVTTALTQKIFPLVTMTIGLPIVYGKEGSSAVVNNGDPSGRRIALGFALKLKGSF